MDAVKPINRKWRYYTPAARISLVQGVNRKEINDRADLYTGSFEALEQAGVLRTELLPPSGSNEITWRPNNTERQEKPNGYWESWYDLPGYMHIRRMADGYHVTLAVSRQEQEARREQQDQAEASRRKSQADAHREYQDEANKKTADQFRACCLDHTELVLALMAAAYRADIPQLYPFTFPADARDEIEERLREVVDLIRTSEVLPLHPEQAPVSRGHLSLVWSAT